MRRKVCAHVAALKNIWYCESCCRDKNKAIDTPQLKMFLRYVDSIVRTIRGEPFCFMDAPSALHPNFHFTLEETRSEKILPYLDLNINISQDIGVNRSWFKNQQIIRLN